MQTLQRRRAFERLESRNLLSAVPLLHSLPGSENKVFLDFDGHVVTGTTWNIELAAIHSPPFDTDGVFYADSSPVFSPEEIDRIISIWERMAEDFRPFDVDVTTEDPSLTAPGIFQVGGRAQRVLFTSKFDAGTGGTGAKWFDRETQGTAAISSWNSATDTPVWVFSTNPLAGEIGSHEVGHALGLHHDGFLGDSGERVEYRGPHGSGETRWSPIMGQGNGLSQWSKGAYPNATNKEDDIGLLVQSLGRRPDDHVAITPLVTGDNRSVNVEGVIGTDADTDIFSFEVLQPRARVQLEFVPWHNGPNLDIGVSLLALGQGSVIGVHDTEVNPVDALASSIDMFLGPGVYYLTVDGVGKAAVPGDPGYSDYGSLGYYRIVGSIGDEVVLVGDTNNDGVLSADDIDTFYAALGDPPVPGSAAWDLNGDGRESQADVDTLVREVFHTEYGDFDLNGRVDFADFLTLSANFGTTGHGWAAGDATGDGEVGFADFGLLAAHFGIDLR